MSDPYEKVKGGRLSFKGGVLASRSKSIDKKTKKKKKKKKKMKLSEEALQSEEGAIATVIDDDDDDVDVDGKGEEEEEEGSNKEREGIVVGGEILYTIDAAKRMKYDQLFPVEAKKFGYDPNSTLSNSTISSSVEQALDDRVKKKADRYCK